VTPYCSEPAGPLRGQIDVPGDKSISHRALILGAMAVGETTVRGLLEGADVMHTAAALRQLGAKIVRDVEAHGQPLWRVHGVGVGGCNEPEAVLDMGNSGTGARLLMGLVASHAFVSFFSGDASLSRRPMQRIIEPLQQIGARFVARSAARLPLAVIGAKAPMPIEYRLPVASAQVKSAILLAGLNTPGRTTIVEPQPSRDHSEIMLRHFGAEILVEETANGAKRLTLTGQPELRATQVTVPADPSSAAFAAVAAAIVPGSDVLLPGVGVNPLRIGLFETLIQMGADLEWSNQRTLGGEPVADLRVRHALLKGVIVPVERAPSMIDEYPILSIAAAFAQGDTIIRGARELRVKETDRIAAVVKGLIDAGVAVDELPDGLVVHGRGRPRGGCVIRTEMDHRIAMAFLVMGLAGTEPMTVDDSSMIETSFPGFAGLMNRLGAKMTPLGDAI
jgi:3-phosphoshikimate 1-carboxyvinyltransferase